MVDTKNIEELLQKQSMGHNRSQTKEERCAQRVKVKGLMESEDVDADIERQ